MPSCCSSNASLDKTWSPAPNQKDDLYSWMAKQHQSTKIPPATANEIPTADFKRPASSSFRRSFLHSSSHHQQTQQQQQHPDSSIRLLDAHLIFEPILTCLGVMPQQMVNNLTNADMSSLESLGTNLSLVGSFDVMRIDIVVSESSDKKAKTRPATRKANGKFTNTEEMPSFLCERVGVELEVLKVTDGLNDNKPNALYVSRGQLKKLTSTVVNFSFNVRYISQQVNMPLLRLLHQITNMYQNVKDAQDELAEQHQPSAGVYRNAMTMKDESSLASEVNDPTIIESIPEPLETSLLDEHYDKFNETFQLNQSSSRTRMPTLGPLIPLTPSPGLRRPQSFAQKLKSTSKSVKGKLGYTNLNDSATTPNKKSPTMSIDNPFRFPSRLSEHKNSLTGTTCALPTVGVHGSSSSNILPPTAASGVDVPNCWRTMFHLLELYATMPETKTVEQR